MTAQNLRLPHPLPYQGSKRKLAPTIGKYLPHKVSTWYEPFAGSIAMTIYAASQGIAEKYVISDSLEAISSLWEKIIEAPESVAEQYSDIWHGQEEGDFEYFNGVRARYNEHHDPVDLLYLTCRCVKNAVRFNKRGHFTQSADKRRRGMRPEKMASAVRQVSALLKGRTEIRHGDWVEAAHDASEGDYVYLDPPYLGTSEGRDKRYANQLTREALIEGLEKLIDRDVPFSLSYDGMTGGKEYGPPLPCNLGMSRLLLHAGVSSQATLVGRREETVESLYVWPALPEEKMPLTIIRSEKPGEAQASLTF